MEQSNKKVYYIGGRSYSPEDSILLCRASEIFATTSLYRTKKGAFFLIQESELEKPVVKLLDESAAKAFLDEHAAGIVVENYNVVFGTPKPG